MAPGWHWQQASISARDTVAFSLRNTLELSVSQLYSFCCIEFAAG